MPLAASARATKVSKQELRGDPNSWQRPAPSLPWEKQALQKVDGSLGAVQKKRAIAEIEPAPQDKELPPKLHLQTMSRLLHRWLLGVAWAKPFKGMHSCAQLPCQSQSFWWQLWNLFTGKALWCVWWRECRQQVWFPLPPCSALSPVGCRRVPRFGWQYQGLPSWFGIALILLYLQPDGLALVKSIILKVKSLHSASCSSEKPTKTDLLCLLQVRTESCYGTYNGRPLSWFNPIKPL